MVMQSKPLDELIRGEMSAVKSFDTVLEKVKNMNEREKLSAMRQDHMHAVEVLRRYAGPDLQEDIQSAGVWGAFTQAFTKSAKVFGDVAAMKALKVGEEHGVEEYKEALEDNTISYELKQIIR